MRKGSKLRYWRIFLCWRISIIGFEGLVCCDNIKYIFIVGYGYLCCKILVLLD